MGASIGDECNVSIYITWWHDGKIVSTPCRLVGILVILVAENDHDGLLELS